MDLAFSFENKTTLFGEDPCRSVLTQCVAYICELDHSAKLSVMPMLMIYIDSQNQVAMLPFGQRCCKLLVTPLVKTPYWLHFLC